MKAVSKAKMLCILGTTVALTCIRGCEIALTGAFARREEQRGVVDRVRQVYGHVHFSVESCGPFGVPNPYGDTLRTLSKSGATQSPSCCAAP